MKEVTVYILLNFLLNMQNFCLNFSVISNLFVSTNFFVFNKFPPRFSSNFGGNYMLKYSFYGLTGSTFLHSKKSDADKPIVPSPPPQVPEFEGCCFTISLLTLPLVQYVSGD